MSEKLKRALAAAFSSENGVTRSYAARFIYPLYLDACVQEDVALDPEVVHTWEDLQAWFERNGGKAV